MSTILDFDLDNNPEFLEYIQKHNPSKESLAFIRHETKRVIDVYDEKAHNVVMTIIKKLRHDEPVATGQMNDEENQVPPSTAQKQTNGKRNARSSSIKNGKALPRKAPKDKRSIVNDALSQEMAEKANVSTTGQAEADKSEFFDDSTLSDIPRGKVRIEVFSPDNEGSPHAGEFRIVEPKANATQICKIGRSCAKEYSEFGFSLHKDLEVSTKHGTLTRKSKNKYNYEYYFTDVGSRNGTFDVSTGNKLTKDKPFLLSNGSQLRLGMSILRFNFSN
jgi:hypothetical protein